MRVLDFVLDVDDRVDLSRRRMFKAYAAPDALTKNEEEKDSSVPTSVTQTSASGK